MMNTKMVMKRKTVLAFSALALTGALLAGCASDDAPSASAQPTSEASSEAKETQKLDVADLSQIPDLVRDSPTAPEATETPLPYTEPIETPEPVQVPVAPEKPEDQPRPEMKTRPMTKAEKADTNLVVVKPDGTPAVALPTEIIVTPAPGNTNPDLVPPPPAEELENPTLGYSATLHYNNLELSDPCLGVNLATVTGIVGRDDFSMKSEKNGQCSFWTPDARANGSVVATKDGTEMTVNYLPADSGYLTPFKSGEAVSGVGETAFVSANEDSTTLVAFKGSYAVLLAVNSPNMSEAKTSELMNTSANQALGWVNASAPEAKSYWVNHPEVLKEMPAPPPGTDTQLGPDAGIPDSSGTPEEVKEKAENIQKATEVLNAMRDFVAKIFS